MGDPKQLSGTEKAYKVEGDPDPWWVSPEAEGAFLERARASGLRVTQPAAMGPLPGQHYGPEDPGLEAGEPSPGGVRPLPKDWGVDTSAPLTEYGTPSKLIVKRPVPPAADFPPKDPALAASDHAAIAATMAKGGGTADVPLRGGGAAAPHEFASGVPGGDDMDAGVGPEGGAEADVGAGTDDAVDPEEALKAASRKALEDSRARAADRASRGPLDNGARAGRGVNAPAEPSRLDTAKRTAGDIYSLGLGDEAAGIGAMGDEFARRHPTSAMLDPILRLMGADIPMRVDRKVRTEAHQERDQNGKVVDVPAGVETQSQMAYTEPKVGQREPAGPGWAQGNRAAEEPASAVGPREPVQHNFLQGEHGVPMTTLDTYLDAGSDAAKGYEANNQAAFDAHPGVRLGTALTTGLPLAVLLRKLGGGSGLAEAEQAAARAAPGMEGWAGRTVAGVKDALTNRGNLGAAAIYGAGHAKVGEPEASPDHAVQQDPPSGFQNALEFAGDAAVKGGTDLAMNALSAPFAEALLEPARMFGRETLRRLRSQSHNPEGAQTLITAMDLGGAQPEWAAKPTEGLMSGPLTSEKGIRSGRTMLDAEEQSLARGSAQPAEDLQEQASNQVTKGLEKQRATETQWIHDQKQDFIHSEKGKVPVDKSALMAAFGEELPPSAQARGRAYVQSRLRKFGPEPAPEPGPSWNFWDEEAPTPPAREPQEPQIEGVDARDLDDMIRVTSDRGKEFKGEDPNNEAFEWTKIAETLRKVRDEHYPRLKEIDDIGSRKLSEFEANASGLGINQNVSPVDVTEGSAHSLSAYERLGEAQAKPPIRSALDRLAPWNPEAQTAMDRSRGVAATQRLIAEAKQGGAAAARARAIGNTVPPRFSIGLPNMSPGMRAAGMQNLGLNSQAVIRSAMSAPVSPQNLQYLYKLLGVRPEQQSQEPQK